MSGAALSLERAALQCSCDILQLSFVLGAQQVIDEVNERTRASLQGSGDIFYL